MQINSRVSVEFAGTAMLVSVDNVQVLYRDLGRVQDAEGFRDEFSTPDSLRAELTADGRDYLSTLDDDDLADAGTVERAGAYRQIIEALA